VPGGQIFQDVGWQSALRGTIKSLELKKGPKNG